MLIRKLTLLAIILLGLSLALRIYIFGSSALTPDQFARYRDSLWYSTIITTGHVSVSPFPNVGPLLSDANLIIFNTISAVTLAQFSMVTLLNFSLLQGFPIATLLIIIFQGLITRNLYPGKKSFLFGIILAAVLQYDLLGVTLTFNRVAEGLLGLYMMLFFLTLPSIGRKAVVLCLVCSTFLILSYSSLALIWISFLVIYSVLVKQRTRIIVLVYLIFTLLYYFVIFSIESVPLKSILGVSQSGFVLDLQFLVPPDLSSGPNFLGTLITREAWPAAIIIVGLTMIWRLSNVLRAKRLELIDKVIVASVIMILLGEIFQNITKSVSGGTDWLFLFYILAPILGTYTLSRMTTGHVGLNPGVVRVLKLGVSVCILLAIISTLLLVPFYLDYSVTQVPTRDVSTSQFIGQWDKHLPLLSSFSFTSTLLSVIGPFPHILPGLNNFQEDRNFYFPDNASALPQNIVYVETSAMVSKGIYSTGGLLLRPNPQIISDFELFHNSLIFNNGEDEVFYIH